MSFLFILASFASFSQEYGDKEFYLIDSLDLDKISQAERELIDTSLIKYHNEQDDTIALSHLLDIVDKSWDPKIWPRYNALMILECQEKLDLHPKEEVKRRVLFYLAGGISNIGYLYDEKGDLLNALDYYHRGLALYEKIGDKEGQSTSFNNLGVIYSVIGDTEKALEYHNKSLEFKKEIKDLEGVAISYNNIGSIYENLEENFVALDYFESSLKIGQETGDKYGMAMSYDNIGDIYFREKVNAKALEYYKKGHAMWSEIENGVGITTSLNNLANVHFSIGKKIEAKEYALQSYEIADELGFPVDIENAAQTLILIYREEEDYKNAFKFADIYIKNRDKTKSVESGQIALKKGLQYEFEKRTLKDSLEFEKQKEVQFVQIKEQKTQAYALIAGICFLMILFLIGIRSYRIKRKDNKKIQEQKQEVEYQKIEIENQHIILAATHKEISDSISYAKRIQEAILPPASSLDEHLKNGFVFYQPKDVVSGDFYWLTEHESKIILAVADCTGHGVPGAMVSVVCHNALNRVLRQFNINEPAKILDQTRKIIIETFQASSENVNDGMDISICCWNPVNNELQWAGANNPLYIIRADRKDEIEIILPDKQPIGKFEKGFPFTNHVIKLNRGDRYYLFTDGYMDQFGGERGKKYKYAKFRSLLVSSIETNMNDQGIKIAEEFKEWKGSLDQVDDVCVVGICV